MDVRAYEIGWPALCHTALSADRNTIYINIPYSGKYTRVPRVSRTGYAIDDFVSHTWLASLIEGKQLTDCSVICHELYLPPRGIPEYATPRRWFRVRVHEMCPGYSGENTRGVYDVDVLGGKYHEMKLSGTLQR